MGETILAYPTRLGLRIAYLPGWATQPAHANSVSCHRHTTKYLLLYSKEILAIYRYNTPSMDASLRYLPVNQSCEVWRVEDNIQKMSFLILNSAILADMRSAVKGTIEYRIHMSWPSLPFGLVESTAKLLHFFELRKKNRLFRDFFVYWTRHRRYSLGFREKENATYAIFA